MKNTSKSRLPKLGTRSECRSGQGRERTLNRALLRDGFVLLVLKILYFRISQGYHLSPTPPFLLVQNTKICPLCRLDV